MSSSPIIKTSKSKKLPPIPSDLKQKYPNCGKPVGYQSLSKVTPKLRSLAQKLLAATKEEVGITYIEDGVEYLLKLDLHFDNHPKPQSEPYWHPGVSVYKKTPGASSDIANKIKIKKYPQSGETLPQQPPAQKEQPPSQQSNQIQQNLSNQPNTNDNNKDFITKLKDIYKQIMG